MNSPSLSRTNAGDASEALRSLRRGLERAQGFALFVAIVKTPAQCHELITLLREAAPALQLQTVTLRPDITDILDEVLRQAGPDLRGPVMIVGLDAALPSDATAQPLLQSLNLRRPEWPQLVRQPVVLWVPGHLYGLLARAVPDFLDWRSDTLHFPDLEPALLHALYSASWDGGLDTQMPLAARMERIRDLESRVAANEFSRDPGIRFTVAGWLNELGLHLQLRGRSREARVCFEKGLAIAREMGDRRGEGTALANLGNTFSTLGDDGKAIGFHEQHLAVARAVKDRSGEGKALGNLGNSYANLGDASKAIAFYEQALAIAREIGDQRGEGNALGSLGNAFYFLGDAHKAIKFYEQALVLMQKLGERQTEASTLGNMGTAYLTTGDVRKALGLYDQSLEIKREIGDHPGEGNGLFNLALSLSSLGHRAEAIATAEAALKIFEQIEDPNAAKVRAQLAEWRRK